MIAATVAPVGAANAATSVWAKTASVAVGSSTAEAVPDPGTGGVFIAASGKVLIADGGTDRLVGQVPVPGVDVQRLVVDAPRGLLYAAGNNGTVTVIDTAGQSVLHRLQVPFVPSGIAVDTASGAVYATSGHDVYAVDPSTGTTHTVAELDSAVDEITVDPASHRLWVSGMFTVSIIDPASGQTRTVLNGAASSHISVDPGTLRGYVTTAERHGVVVVDEASGQERGLIRTGQLPLRSTIDPAHHTLLVADDADATISVVDTTTNTVTDTVAVPDRPWWVGINPVTQKAYVSSANTNAITVLGRVSAPHITTPELPDGSVGAAYSVQLHADARVDRWSVTGGALPEGLHLNKATGQITGTPHSAHTTSVSVTAANAAGRDTCEYTITVASAPSDATGPDEADNSGADGSETSTGAHLPVVSG